MAQVKVAPAMSIAKPLWNLNLKKEIFLFQGLTDRVPATKSILTTKINLNSSAFQVGHPHANHNRSSCGIDVSGDLRTPCEQGLMQEALHMLRLLDQRGIRLNSSIYDSWLRACLSKEFLPAGKLLHAHMIATGFKPDIFLGTKLVIMYGSCGYLSDSRRVLNEMPEQNVVSWNTVILGYAQNGSAHEAFTLFARMQQDGVTPNSGTLVSILPACAHLVALQRGKEIHAHIIRNEFESNVFLGSALVVMYARCGDIDTARKIFDKMSQRDVVSWSAMLTAYTQNGHANEALKLFRQMHWEGVKPNAVTIAGVLPACGDLASLQQGKEIHNYIIRNKFESNVFVWSALIDMYSKCGIIDVARQVFDKISQKDVISWTAMIAGYGMNGHGDDAVTVFNQMRQAGLTPNHITFVAVLSACSRAGLIVEGWQYFNCMTRDYHITPRVEHYACMVDLLSRAGHLNEAETFIREMPLEPNACVWGALLGACRIHCNIQLGERVAEQLLELEPENDGNYVLLSNIYAAAGRWDDAAKVRTMMKDRGLKKRPGCSWIVVKNKVHAFLVGDRSNPQSEKIYAMLESLDDQIKEAGYVPDKNFVLHDVEEKEKENFLSAHSEKLAIAFGLINTCPGTPIRITKNLRVCGDCHTASKFISKIVRREIIVRDVNRFHHFKDGLCSYGA